MSKPKTEANPHQEYVRALARQAYLWGWPMVNMINRHNSTTQTSEPGLFGGILPAAPEGQVGMLHDYIVPEETFVTCPNQDVVYGLGFFDLDKGPVIAQVPDFGDRFWVYALYDQRTDQFGELGKPYGTKSGFYLLVGPKWNGEVPNGIAGVVRASTSLANAIHGSSRTIPRRQSGDPIRHEKEVIAPFFRWEHNGKPAGNGWNRSVNNAQWGVDYFDRTGTSKSNMFDNRPNETQYFYTDYDGSGAQLEGSKTYSMTFPAGQEPPVSGFWSLTLYNDKHLFHPNDLKRYSLGTKNKNLKRNADGSLTLYASAKSPGADKESNWLPAPEGPFSLYIRAYWGKQPILDGSWQPPKIGVVN